MVSDIDGVYIVICIINIYIYIYISNYFITGSLRKLKVNNLFNKIKLFS